MSSIGCTGFFLVSLAEVAREITGPTVSNFPALDRGHRGDFNSCARQEEFVSGEEFCEFDGPFNDLVSLVPRDIECESPGDARQYSLVERGSNDSLASPENDVAGRCLGDATFTCQEQSVVVALGGTFVDRESTGDVEPPPSFGPDVL